MVSLQSLRQTVFWLCVARCEGVSTAGFRQSCALLLSLCLNGISAVKVTLESLSEHPLLGPGGDTVPEGNQVQRVCACM